MNMFKKIGALFLGALAAITPVAAIDLADYPGFFLNGERLDASFVVGDDAPADDVIAAIDIAAGIQAGTGLSSIIVGPSVLASEVRNPFNQNLIVVGNACNNPVARRLLRLNNCRDHIIQGDAEIRLLQNQGKFQVIVAGEKGQDTRKAALALANFDKFDFEGRRVLVGGEPSFPRISIVYERGFGGTVSNQPLPSQPFVESPSNLATNPRTGASLARTTPTGGVASNVPRSRLGRNAEPLFVPPRFDDVRQSRVPTNRFNDFDRFNRNRFVARDLFDPRFDPIFFEDDFFFFDHFDPRFDRFRPQTFVDRFGNNVVRNPETLDRFDPRFGGPDLRRLDFFRNEDFVLDRNEFEDAFDRRLRNQRLRQPFIDQRVFRNNPNSDVFLRGFDPRFDRFNRFDRFDRFDPRFDRFNNLNDFRRFERLNGFDGFDVFGNRFRRPLRRNDSLLDRRFNSFYF